MKHVSSTIHKLINKTYSPDKDCVVPENIYTPTTEGIGHSRGVGGVKDPGNSRGDGGWTIDLESRCASIQYEFRYRSRCSKILSYLLSRSFT